jgi:hypothetical protein
MPNPFLEKASSLGHIFGLVKMEIDSIGEILLKTTYFTRNVKILLWAS